MKKGWCIPPRANGAFVCAMEEVLALYTRPYDPRRPLLGMDEAIKQLVADCQPPLALRPGQPQRVDYEYERAGVATLFMFFEPLAGQRYVQVRSRRTKVDWAQAMREIADHHYPDAEKIVVVLDNLNTHTPAAFYDAFEPCEARRLTERFEFHYTPKHGSWLNMAEIELSVLARQCLQARIPDIASLQQTIAAWQATRNALAVQAHWQFTTAAARIKLKHLYPKFDP